MQSTRALPPLLLSGNPPVNVPTVPISLYGSGHRLVVDDCVYVYLGLGLNNVNAVARYVVVAATLFRRGAGEGGCEPGSEPVPPLPRPPGRLTGVGL